jgi:hypothetical protein
MNCECFWARLRQYEGQLLQILQQVSATQLGRTTGTGEGPLETHATGTQEASDWEYWALAVVLLLLYAFLAWKRLNQPKRASC